MKLDRTLARRLSTASELELLESSAGTALKELSESRLRANIARARRLRDKQRDLLRRQRLASRARTGTKHGARPGSNARTGEKARLFEQALGRFEERLQALQTPARPGKARSPRLKAIQTHVKSRGRRTQARRDARR